MAGIAYKNRLIDPFDCISCLLTSRKEIGEKELLHLARKTRGRTELFVKSFDRLLAKGVRIEDSKIELNRKFMDAISQSIFEGDLVDFLLVLAMANKVDYRMNWRFNETSGGWDIIKKNIDDKLKKRIDSLFYRAKAISIFLDNSGEAIYDIAFAMHLALNERKKVYLISKKKPYEIDVTIEEAKKIFHSLTDKIDGLNVIPDTIEFLHTGSEYPAPVRRYLEHETLKKISLSDLVVSKGIANLEALMEECWPEPEKTIVLLTAKCPPISKIFHTKLGMPVISIGYPCRR